MNVDKMTPKERLSLVHIGISIDAIRAHTKQIWKEKSFLYPQGTQLRWATGKYKGRYCDIHATTFCCEEMDILVRVRTYRKHGEGYVDDNDSFHREWRSLREFFIDERFE